MTIAGISWWLACMFFFLPVPCLLLSSLLFAFLLFLLLCQMVSERKCNSETDVWQRSRLKTRNAFVASLNIVSRDTTHAVGESTNSGVLFQVGNNCMHNVSLTSLLTNNYYNNITTMTMTGIRRGVTGHLQPKTAKFNLELLRTIPLSNLWVSNCCLSSLTFWNYCFCSLLTLFWPCVFFEFAPFTHCAHCFPVFLTTRLFFDLCFCLFSLSLVQYWPLLFFLCFSASVFTSLSPSSPL
jgi:hypothetical protein